MSTVEFTMPSLGADMDDGVITEWLVAPGDEVRRGQIVVVVETDKSDIEVEVFDHAVVDALLVPEGERVAVGTPIARLRPIGAAAPETAPTPVITSPLVRHLADELHVDPARVHGSGPGGRVHRDDVLVAAHDAPADPAPTDEDRRLTPRARRLAAEHGLEPTEIAANGPVVNGDDVLAVADGRTGAPPLTSPSVAPSPVVAVTTGDEGADPVRRAVAALMTRSWSEIPHFHVATRLDLAAPLARLTDVNAGRPIDERLLPAALVLHAVANVAGRVPAVNGWWVGGRFRPAEHVDLGVVVALRGGGVVVPTIRRADELSVDEMMVELTGVVARARARRLRGSDVGEASLTVTNLGDLGTDAVFGVIHPPQVALIGVGAIHDEPVAADGLLGVHPVVHVTLAGDHRALDGLVGATFLSKLAGALAASAASIPDRRETT